MTTTAIPASYDLVLLATATLHFREDAYRLQLRREGEEEWREVTLLRLFPLSEPLQWISVRNDKGEEIGIVQELHGLPPESLTCLRRYLRRYYLVPVITHIYSTTSRFDLCEWEVETNRGRMHFIMRNPHESIKQLLPGMFTLTDMEGTRYDVPDIASLDPESRLLLEARI